MRMLLTSLIAAGSLMLGAEDKPVASGAQAIYLCDFQSSNEGKPPEDMMVLDGEFEVKKDGDNKFLELPGAPLETFGVLFGPDGQKTSKVSARIFGSKKGRQFPVFGVGVNGRDGFIARVSPAKNQIELIHQDQAVASAEFAWKSDGWTRITVQMRKEAAGMAVRAKVWNDGDAEPEKPQIEFTPKDEVPSGRASIWGSPFSKMPIRFDDLKVVSP